ncbi:hypothetical protein [Solidesulfovibrio alcoholivorans]|uniref:hypothetical protein n=1 Tax=Solidesulfovibrio alcoholivorans TaxID=81406 RepID=UPI0004955F94|nr:hypothetical protein [Solidesulfovibrio alcoholivorans]
MATDKPLPDADDDIIDLTDLVEEGPGEGKAAADDGPVDMSFEQELEDLFGDADPGMPKDAAPKPAAAAAASAASTDAADADDGVIDLAGLGLDDEAPAQSAAASATSHDDDIMDLSGLGLDEDVPATPPLKAKGEVDEADDDLDFAGLGFDEDTDKKAAPLSEDAAMADLFADADKDIATPEAEPEAEVALEPGSATAPESVLAEDAMDLGDMDLEALAPEPKEATEADDAAMADLLGELPDAALPEDIDVADLSSLSALEEPAPAPGPAAAAPAAAAAVGAATLGAVAVAATAAATPAAQAGVIDLGALDNLIDAAKGPAPEPEPGAPEDRERLEAQGKRLEAVETAIASLLDRIESLSATDGDALADALSARLEDALSERLEAVLAGLPQPDTEGLHARIMAELDTRAVKDRTKMLADLASTLDQRFETLVAGLPKPEAPEDLSGALETLGQSLERLEAQAGERETAFKDFASSVETHLAELRRELPEPGEFVTQAGLHESLETLRETLARDIAGNLDERLGELRRELRESLAGDIAAGLDERLGAVRGELREALAEEIAAALDERLGGVAEGAQKAAREEAQALGEVLSGRIEALETDRIDPDALTQKIRDALLADLPDAAAMERLAAKPDRKDLDDAVEALRKELAASLEKSVPQVAATVIREEIAALLKDFS